MKRHVDTHGHAAATQEVEEAVARLVEVARVDRTAAHGDEGAGVLLDVICGRIRCVLLPAPPQVQSVVPALTPREQEIARMVSRGYTNRTIASVLEISLWTVSTHLRRIYAKLGVTSRAAMVTRLLEAHENLPSVPTTATVPDEGLTSTG